MIYLDHNATTPVDPEVYDAVLSSLKRDFGNPSSSHYWGRKARESVESSRTSIAEFIGCRPEEIFFTSGGTESNNLAIIGTALQHKKGHIVTSSIEHPSVMNCCRYLESLGYELTSVPVDNDGIAKVQAVRESLRSNTILISVMHSNNETGVLQPIQEISALAGEKGITFHVDAAQSLGKMLFGMSDSPIDLLTIVSHKFYGPKGIGALYVRRGTSLKSILFGAGHEGGMRPGTENVPGIVGLGKACHIAKRDMKLRVAHTTQLRDLLFDALKSGVSGIKLNGHPDKRLPNTLNVSIPGVTSFDLVEFIRDEVAVSAGSACHAGNLTPSAVLKSMGLSDADAISSVRLSVGKDNSEQEIREAARIMIQAINDLKDRNAAP